MCSTGIKGFTILACLAIVACIVAAQDTGGSCSSCNCQFNNVQVLDQYIQNKIATFLANQNGE